MTHVIIGILSATNEVEDKIMSAHDVNAIIIESPGTDPEKMHRVSFACNDDELLALKKFISRVTLGDTESPDEAATLHSLYILLVESQETSP